MHQFLSHLLDNRCSLFLRDLSWGQLMWDGVYWLMNNLHWFPAKTKRAHYWIEYNDSNFITQIFSIWTMNEISKKQKKIYSWWRILPFIFSHHIFFIIYFHSIWNLRRIQFAQNREDFVDFSRSNTFMSIRFWICFLSKW